LNGPSYVTALNATGNLEKSKASFQLGNWPEIGDKVGNDRITFGGNVEGAFRGKLKLNLILKDSSWLFNLNY
jgi:hypothetical protein